jgi:hypothetical protein
MPERPRPVTRPLPIKLPLPLFLLPLLLRFQLRRSRLGASRGWASIELDDFARANAELQLYRNADVTSEMAYQMWAHIRQERESLWCEAEAALSRKMIAGGVISGR